MVRIPLAADQNRISTGRWIKRQEIPLSGEPTDRINHPGSGPNIAKSHSARRESQQRWERNLVPSGQVRNHDAISFPGRRFFKQKACTGYKETDVVHQPYGRPTGLFNYRYRIRPMPSTEPKHDDACRVRKQVTSTARLTVKVLSRLLRRLHRPKTAFQESVRLSKPEVTSNSPSDCEVSHGSPRNYP